jgi:uncharacterized protein HemX
MKSGNPAVDVASLNGLVSRESFTRRHSLAAGAAPVAQPAGVSLSYGFQPAIIRLAVAIAIGLAVTGVAFQSVRLASFFQELTWCEKMAAWYDQQGQNAKEQAARYLGMAANADGAQRAQLTEGAAELEQRALDMEQKAAACREVQRRRSFGLW